MHLIQFPESRQVEWYSISLFPLEDRMLELRIMMQLTFKFAVFLCRAKEKFNKEKVKRNTKAFFLHTNMNG